VLPQDNTNLARLVKEDIKSAIERVAQFADERIFRRVKVG
jgi:hypothetical protein